MDAEYLKRVCPYLKFSFFSGNHLNEKDCIDLITKCQELGVEIVGVTRGKKGSIFSGPKKKIIKKTIVNTEVVDTLGAGDSYISMFLLTYYKTNSIEISMNYASISAAKTCVYHGAFGYGYDIKVNS